MGHTATLNIRIPEPLKHSGSEVLAHAGVSVSDAVRSMFEYMAKEQAVPDFIDNGDSDRSERRRALLRDMTGCAPASDGLSLDEYREARLDEKYREYL